MATTQPARSGTGHRLAGASAALILAASLTACGSTATEETSTEAATTAAETTSEAEPSTEDTASATGTTETTAAGDLTAAVQEAAAAFVATLDADQLAMVTYDYDDSEAKSVWSNLPVGSAGSTNATSSNGSSDSGQGGGMGTARNGLAVGDMTEEQEAAALAVVETIMSEQGYQQVLDIMAADDILAASGNNIGWSSDYYFLAFFGDPTTTDTFFIQFGGHHLAINADFQGEAVSIVPEFIGVEPISYTNEAGETVEALSGETTSIQALYDSLSADELAAAQLSTTWADLAKGAGEDATDYPSDTTEGLLVSDLTADQQALVTEIITQWAGDLDEATSAELIAQYATEYSETYVAWSVTTDLTSGEAFFRVSGPGVWIEYSQQPGIGTDGWHIHTVYRDKVADYNAAG